MSCDDVEESDFMDFVRNYVNYGGYDFSSPHLAEKVRKHGFEYLSPQQQEEIIDELSSRFGNSYCSKCGDSLSWGEMFHAIEHDLACGRCAERLSTGD